MELSYVAQDLSSHFCKAVTVQQVQDCLAAASRHIGFDHFALSLSSRSRGGEGEGVLLHDYPDQWARIYLGCALAGRDPVRRACDGAMAGFQWSHLDRLIALTRGDREILEVGRECGVANGYTVPRHLPGAASGSCSFVVQAGAPITPAMAAAAEMVGTYALASVARIRRTRRHERKPGLSDRQRECLILWARGNSAAQIGRLLGISEETVNQHLKTAKERYDVDCRQELVLHALYEGAISFAEIFDAGVRREPQHASLRSQIASLGL